MTNYNPKPGDIVNFRNVFGVNHRGTVMDVVSEMQRPTNRNILVKFNGPIWDGGPDIAWCAAEDLTLIWPTLRKDPKVNPTVTYTNSSTIVTSQFDNQNLKLEKDNKLAQSSVSFPDKPWTKYYVTADEFFEILRVAFDDTYGGGQGDLPWHPEDMYLNVSSTLEIVANTLSNMANVKAGRPLRRVKEV